MALYAPVLSLVLVFGLLFWCSEAHDSQLLMTRDPSTSSGFNLDLIHREYSPLSPFYNPAATNFERLKNTIRRSNSRVSYFQSKRKNPSSSSGTIESEIIYDSTEYLMKLHIGTPPVETLVIADTGSDLTWVQCNPCKKCFEHIYPLFDLRASSSYKTLKCTSKQCKAFRGHAGTCTRKHNKCQYKIFYADGSVSYGHLATEKLTFGKTSIEKVAFGCGHYNQGIFGNGSSGIVGLGRSPLSLINQLDETIHGKFSYCLVPIYRNETSTISFGEELRVSDSNTISTPLFQNSLYPYYFLQLEKVFIGNKSFEFKPRKEAGVEHGNIIIDSGTTLTFLPNGTFYNGILSALKEAIGNKTIKDPEGFFDLCYKTSSKVKVPVIAFQFTGAKLLKLPAESIFLEIDDDLTCFIVVPSDNVSIIGNIMQGNLQVSYDLHENKVSIQATDCSKK